MAKIASFSEATYIALHCMVLIAKNGGERMSVKEMASRLSVSESHLAKVIMKLSHAGLLDTTRGPGGGAVLGRSPEEISFLEIVECIEGPMETPKCVFGRKSCVYGACIFGGFLGGLVRDAGDWLSGRSLADFIDAGVKGERL